MVSAPFWNIDLNPAYEFLEILNVTKTFLLETGKYQYKSVNQLLPTEIGNCRAADANMQRMLTFTNVSIRCNPRAADANMQRMLTFFLKNSCKRP